MRLSTLTQRTELREAEQRHDIVVPVAIVALIAALVLAFGGHWIVALCALAAGGFVFFNTAAGVRAVGDPDSAEKFYQLANPHRPLELPQPEPADAIDPVR
ncbi:hypothetical protein [Longimicrobium sp.]|uniref:hypothetical protein n=1 Tax=Longimicrobium sp. TaxID=2029185 RepID=UPI002CA8105A|nr:hypothetical protein [Longimicrobium sp.]HSU14434.1 hypothetical protein [Longimicrobium sp.]